MKDNSFLNDLPFVVPENSSEEFWQMSGRVEALRGYIKRIALDRAETVYYSTILPDELKMVASIMGFDDVLAIKRKEEEA